MRALSFPKITRQQLVGDPWPFVTAWVVSGLLAVLIPVIHWSRKKNEYYSYMGKYYEYQQAQQEYEQANNGQNNQNQNWYASNCSWWQWSCKRNANQYYNNNNNNNNNGGSGDNNVNLPGWYYFIGGKSEEDQREMEENGSMQASGAVKFIYSWTLIMFIGIVSYGVYVLGKGYATSGLRLAIFLLAQFVLLGLLMTGQGLIETDGRAMEESVYGWHGQLGVLLAYTDFWILLYCVIFTVALTVRAVVMSRRDKNADERDTEYHKYDEERPSVTVT